MSPSALSLPGSEALSLPALPLPLKSLTLQTLSPSPQGSEARAQVMAVQDMGSGALLGSMNSGSLASPSKRSRQSMQLQVRQAHRGPGSASGSPCPNPPFVPVCQVHFSTTQSCTTIKG